MSAEHAVSADIPADILETIFEAAGDATHWQAALRQIADWIGAVGAAYFVLNHDGSTPRVTALHSSGFAASADIEYSKTGHLADPHMQLGMATPFQGWFLSQDHFDPAFISRNPFFQEVMGPLGIRWVAGSRLWRVERDIGCVALQKPIDDRGFTEEERRRLHALSPHLGRATRLHSRLARTSLTADIGLEAINALTNGIAVMDANVRVLFANQSAERMLRQQSVFKSIGASRVSLRHRGSHEAFTKALREACAGSSTALRVFARDSMPAISIVALPLPASSRWNAPRQRPLALLTMSELACVRSIPHRWLAQLFGLTPKESLVANWMCSGRTIDDYARDRGVSIETARTQLKAVLSKAGLSRQTELVAALSRLSLQEALTE